MLIPEDLDEINDERLREVIKAFQMNKKFVKDNPNMPKETAFYMKAFIAGMGRAIEIMGYDVD